MKRWEMKIVRKKNRKISRQGYTHFDDRAQKAGGYEEKSQQSSDHFWDFTFKTASSVIFSSFLSPPKYDETKLLVRHLQRIRP